MMISIGKKKKRLQSFASCISTFPPKRTYTTFTYSGFTLSPPAQNTQFAIQIVSEPNNAGCCLHTDVMYSVVVCTTHKHTHTHTRLSIRFVCRARGQSYRAIRLAVHISQIDLLYGAKRILCTLSLNVL